jgi:hypothetical protein
MIVYYMLYQLQSSDHDLINLGHWQVCPGVLSDYPDCFHNCVTITILDVKYFYLCQFCNKVFLFTIFIYCIPGNIRHRFIFVVECHP